MEVCDTAAGVTVCQRQLVFKEEKLTAPKSVVGLTQPRGPFTEKIDAAALRALPDLERADLDEVAQLSLEELCDMIQLLADRLYALGLVGSGTVGVAFFDAVSLHI